MIDDGHQKLLEQALTSPNGLKISTTNAAELRLVLARAAESDPDARFSQLKFRLSPSNASDLWIINGKDQ